MIIRSLLLILFQCSINLLPIEAQSDTFRIEIRAISGMQYDRIRFAVKPGSLVTLILKNDDEMEHNLIIGSKGSREKIVSEALKLGQAGPAEGYIPSIPEVLWSTGLLRSGESDSIRFRAPRHTGAFPYVCTYPGHGTIMFGAMYVTNGALPSLEVDENVPAHRRISDQDRQEVSQVSGHPYLPEAPFLYRVLMPDAGPASIAVCLPNKINFCWDAGSCRLRYAWSGEFLDLMDYWTVKGELHAKILGSIFFKDMASFPFQVDGDDGRPNVHFKGYRLVGGYPEFHYMMNELEVFELLTPAAKGVGLDRRFKFQSSKTLWFVHGDHDGVRYQSDKGIWSGNRLKINPEDSAEFTITMLKSEL